MLAGGPVQRDSLGQCLEAPGDAPEQVFTVPGARFFPKYIRLVWEAAMPDELQRYGGTMAPLVVKDMVIAGVSGGDWGIRGFVDAYDAATGEKRWRHWTVACRNNWHTSDRIVWHTRLFRPRRSPDFRELFRPRPRRTGQYH